jgi:hypothetical protein
VRAKLLEKAYCYRQVGPHNSLDNVMAIQDTATPKQLAQTLIAQLPDNASWQDVLYFLEVRADIESGLEDIKANRHYSVEEIRKDYGLPK